MWYQVWIPESRLDKKPMIFGVHVKNGIVTDAHPIMNWSIGKRWDAAKSWVELELEGIVTQI